MYNKFLYYGNYNEAAAIFVKFLKTQNTNKHVINDVGKSTTKNQ